APTVELASYKIAHQERGLLEPSRSAHFHACGLWKMFQVLGRKRQPPFFKCSEEKGSHPSLTFQRDHPQPPVAWKANG
ncbi:hypothetical protein ACLOJK_010237, partial [Asimina triloba]